MLSALCIVGMCLSPASGRAGTRRFAVILGNNVGRDSARTLRFAHGDAMKVHDVLVERGDFAPSDTVLLIGATAEQALRALEDVEHRILAAVDNGATVLLLVYFSGHADGHALEMGASSLAYVRFKELLSGSAAKVRIGIVDSCKSGRLLADKSARRVPGFEIHLTDELASAGLAVITSSADNEVSRESEEIRGSFFTHYLVSALRGAADRSGDGRVTLGEAYEYAFTHTVARTSATVGGVQHPMYEYHLVGQGDVPLTRIAEDAGRVVVSAPEDGRLVLLDHQREVVVAEANVRSGQPLTLGVPWGRYHAFLLSKGGSATAAVEVSPQGTSHLDADAFVRHELRRAVTKGGLFRPRFSHRLSIGLLLRRWPLADAALSYGAAIQYRAVSPWGWYPSARVIVSAAPDQGVARDNVSAGLHCGGGWQFDLGSSARLAAEVEAGYEHLFQGGYAGRSHSTAAFAYLGSASVEFPMGSWSVGVQAGAGGRIFKLVERGWVHRLDLQAITTLAWRLAP